MDYQRIYSEFIADRLVKQPVKPAYFEKHHIVPRALGGADTVENLIRLTPEDHYFAHCCLAKIHGGKMWFALKSMGNGWSMSRDWRENCRSTSYRRAMFSVARKNSAKENSSRMQKIVADGGFSYFAKSGVDNVLHNPTEYEWLNLDTGAEVKATIYAMWQQFGSSRAHWTSVQSGARRSHAGWALKGYPVRIRGLKGKVLTFSNQDGRTHTGTQSSFCKLTGLSAAVASRVSRHGNKTLCGWYLKTE